MNGLQLLLEVTLALIRVQLHADLSIQFLFDPQNFQFPHEDFAEEAVVVREVGGLEKLLLLAGKHQQMS